MQKKKLKFIASMAKALHSYGAASYHIENAMVGVAERLLYGGDFFATPTQINCAVEDAEGHVETRMIRVSPGGVNLSKLSEVDALVDLVVAGHCSVDEGLLRLSVIEEQGDPWWLKRGMPLAFACCSALFSTFFGAQLIDMVVSGILSLMMYFLLEWQTKLRLSSLVEFVGALLVTLFAYLLVGVFPSLMPEKVILGSLVVLIPGLSITVALAEISVKQLMAGTARLMGSFMELLKMSLGVFMGTKLASLLIITKPIYPHPAAPMILPEWQVLTFSIICFTFLFKVKPRDIPFVMVVSLCGFYGAKLGAVLIGQELGIFLGGFVIGVGSNAFARLLKRPALTVLLPGLLPLVPGSIGYKSLNFLFAMEVMDAMTNAFSLLILAITLVTGLALGHALIPPRRSI